MVSHISDEGRHWIFSSESMKPPVSQFWFKAMEWRPGAESFTESKISHLVTRVRCACVRPNSVTAPRLLSKTVAATPDIPGMHSSLRRLHRSLGSLVCSLLYMNGVMYGVQKVARRLYDSPEGGRMPAVNALRRCERNGTGPTQRPH
ncbi:unnamed protein product [Danaus chrysippus]|uniref:(African queen) hypothetical protein n=1 Tax=Danaus chrysippus TaxID=151541 RepID=A0A8J2QE65_9NEOP|nr:unnamed protein product [Danaus chrysippus]